MISLSMNVPAWRYYLRLYRGHHRPLLLSIAVSIGQSLIVLPIALLLQHAFDTLIPAGEISSLTLTGLALVALYLMSGGATLWTRHLVLRTSKTIIQMLREEVLKRLYAFSRSYYDQADEGKLHTIVVQDTERVDIMTNALLAQLLPAVCVSLVLSGVLVYLSWFLFLFMLGVLPPLLVLSRIVGRTARWKTRAFHRAFERFSRGILFVLEMMDLTRIRAAERLEFERQRRNLSELRFTSGDMAWMRTAHVLLHNTIVAVAGVIILIAGGTAMALGRMTMGELLSFYTATVLLRSQLSLIFSCIPQIIEGNESLTTLYRLRQTEDASPYNGRRRIPFRGGVALSDVTFRYAETPVLHDLTLSVDPGTIVAIVGPNGSGKSTIAYLILGFYRPQEGHVYADDHPLDDLDLAALRRRIGIVTQQQMVFSGTIRDNITYGHPDCSFEQLTRAAQLATADEFIQRLPNGYETSVGDRGVKLSGGERQRMAIARALIAEPSLLILDEPTVHLDTDAVGRLMRNLRALSNAPATLVISHDTTVVQEADRTYVLEDGRIVE